jgi:D-glycero-D-manno-heptose 1,7-bisphosphate phosphatase
VGIRAVSRPAVFLDRDGVLVEDVFYPESGEWEAPWGPEDVRLITGAAEATRTLTAAGYALVVISNQGAFAKGKTTLRRLWLAHERFAALLAAEGAALDAVFYSYGHPDGVEPHFSGPSLDRKPGPYNVFIAAAQLDLDLGASWFVGDRATDIACAEAAGVRPILVRNLHAVEPAAGSFCARDLLDAAKHIKRADEVRGA